MPPFPAVPLTLIHSGCRLFTINVSLGKAAPEKPSYISMMIISLSILRRSLTENLGIGLDLMTKLDAFSPEQ